MAFQKFEPYASLSIVEHHPLSISHTSLLSSFPLGDFISWVVLWSL